MGRALSRHATIVTQAFHDMTRSEDRLIVMLAAIVVNGQTVQPVQNVQTMHATTQQDKRNDKQHEDERQH